ncbi:MAG TPA: cation:proton antiporter [Streptosporangiaceae bacterium]|nr:cation:proton antiporter [Streptosporangiaceae bacterium]
MGTVSSFGLAVLVAAAAGIAAVLSSRASERLRIPAPAFFLLAAAAAAYIWPWLGRLSIENVQRVATVALAVILFDGGMRMGWRRLRPAVAATVWLGVAGTLVTAAAVAVAAHLLFSFGWHAALLIGTALAPTDPAVVFSVLGRREIAGRSGVLLEGESGANDPVGIALLVALLSAGNNGTSAAGHVLAEFAVQMAVGIVIGIVGGRALLVFMRRVSLPSEGLYTLRVLLGALAIYGLATIAHGSGFLAVFVAGILIGDERAPYKAEIAHFHSALASLAEIVAFVLLGLTIRLDALPQADTWPIGLALAALLAFAIRPLLVGLVLWPIRLRFNERLFVLWSGLKGAVPILLGAFIVQSGLADGPRIYEIIFVVVAFSVILQGGLVPSLAGRLGIPLRTIEPEPWSLGIRLQSEPENIRRFLVAADATADRALVRQLALPRDAWISFIIRAGQLIPAHADTMLQADDEVVVLASSIDEASLREIFGS